MCWPIGWGAEASMTDLFADVLVIGGGPAGTWAALSAAERGVKVLLADKGFCGTSGATAAAGTQIWYIPPNPDERKVAMASREAMGGHLANRAWCARVLDTTWDAVNRLAGWGYPFPVDAAGTEHRLSVQGPEYMRLMRKRVKAAGVRILDHAPALALRQDAGGRVVGAEGVLRQAGGAPWSVRAGAVILATGGCAFRSHALGCDTLTGEGLLMAAEVGASLSGMEFSNAYAIAPLQGSVTKTAIYKFATFLYPDGTPIPGAGSARGRSVIARELMTGPVHAILDQAPEALRPAIRLAQPNFFLPFDRLGIDPFRTAFPVTLRLEGTVRGTGGLAIADDGCATVVEGLYAAGDAATRELICGGFTGGGSHNSAWAISSGIYAGHAAAGFAARRPTRDPGQASHLPAVGRLGEGELQRAVQDEVFPYDRNYFRSGAGLAASLERLDRLWAHQASEGIGGEVLRAREAQAMLSVARWMYRSANARTESRGMHRRSDFAAIDPGQQHYLRIARVEDPQMSRHAVAA
jgi:succinate dehydrogenase/fumarate reductase flavoprotein subunit